MMRDVRRLEPASVEAENISAIQSNTGSQYLRNERGADTREIKASAGETWQTKTER